MQIERFEKLIENLIKKNLIDINYKVLNTNTDLLNLTFYIIQKIGYLKNNSRYINSNSFLDIEKYNIENTNNIFRNGIIALNKNNLNYKFKNYSYDEIAIYEDINYEKLKILNNSQENDVIIDIGYKDAYWTTRVIGYLNNKCIKIGIDPIDNNCAQYTDYYFNCAIDNIKENIKMEFNIFDEPGCNSLLNKSDSLDIRNIISKKYIDVVSLESIIDKLNLINNNIYYIKCDVQGKDKDAILSLGKYLKNLQYFELEMLFSAKDSLYENQSFVLEDIIELYDYGFIPIHCTIFNPLIGDLDNLEDKLILEGEIIFKKKN